MGARDLLPKGRALSGGDGIRPASRGITNADSNTILLPVLLMIAGLYMSWIAEAGVFSRKIGASVVFVGRDRCCGTQPRAHVSRIHGIGAGKN